MRVDDSPDVADAADDELVDETLYPLDALFADNIGKIGGKVQ